MSRVLTGDAALRREERLQKREDRLTDKTSDLRAQIASLTAENEKLSEALRGVEPYLDAIVCYASTMGEHEGNRIAAAARAALQPKEGS